jgi:hypothetical protein
VIAEYSRYEQNTTKIPHKYKVLHTIYTLRLSVGGRMDARTDGRMDGWMDGRTDGRMDGRTDGWTDKKYLLNIQG